jgi:hypothetical protein
MNCTAKFPVNRLPLSCIIVRERCCFILTTWVSLRGVVLTTGDQQQLGGSYSALLRLVRHYLQDLECTFNVYSDGLNFTKTTPDFCYLTTLIRCITVPFVSAFVSSVLLLSWCSIAFRIPLFIKVVPRHPGDHLQFMSSFDYPLFCSVNTVPLYDILAATCEVPLFRTFVSLFTYSW